jgi:valyl-tRNA synthetase
MGHAFNNTLQDILVRWHRMRGFDTLWQAGTDHAGIATQMVVERQLAERGEPGRVALGREKFLEKVWQWKEQSGGTIVNNSNAWAPPAIGTAQPSPWQARRVTRAPAMKIAQIFTMR